MAKPRVFVSSSYYDLKHIRSSLDLFIEALGFESILSEKGSIAYHPDQPLDESCYREAQTADIFVLIVGGRYGSAASREIQTPTREFLERYDSITKKEYQSAIDKEIPTYILIDASVYAEYQTFLKNKQNSSVSYAHVDSVNIFHFIEEILVQPRNNPIHAFERFSDIEAWLGEQWAGLFRELLNRRSQQQQLVTLSFQVEALKQISVTLQKYLETVVSKITTPGEASELISSEKKRLKELEKQSGLLENTFFRHLTTRYGLSAEQAFNALRNTESFDGLAREVGVMTGEPTAEKRLAQTLRESRKAREDLNSARLVLGLKAFEEPHRKSEITPPPKVKAAKSGGS